LCRRDLNNYNGLQELRHEFYLRIKLQEAQTEHLVTKLREFFDADKMKFRFYLPRVSRIRAFLTQLKCENPTQGHHFKNKTLSLWYAV